MQDLLTKHYIPVFLEGQIKPGNIIINDYKNFHQIKKLENFKAKIQIKLFNIDKAILIPGSIQHIY